MGRLTSNNVHILYLGSVFITGEIKCLSGLHIGSSDDSLKIGGIDKYVIKNPKDNTPYIPGSSLKGKMRSILEKRFAKPAKRSGGDGIYRYEADDANEAIRCEVSRLFGSTSKGGEAMNFPARLTVRDTAANAGFMLEKKSENTLDRLSAHANPRTNERVSKDSTFNLDLKYDIEVVSDEHGNILLGSINSDSINDYWRFVGSDLNHILDALLLIECSSLGGNGSRGYGKVVFEGVAFHAKTVQEILGEPAPPGTDPGVLPTIPLRTDKFHTVRDRISGILTQFNGAYSQINATLAPLAVSPPPTEVLS